MPFDAPLPLIALTSDPDFDLAAYHKARQLQADLATLRKALAGLKKGGSWMQHRFNSLSNEDTHCAVGWIKVYSADSQRICSQHLAPELQAMGYCPTETPSQAIVVRYNDTISRRKRDIVRLFERAIAKLEKL